MSFLALDATEAVERLSRRDPTLKHISLTGKPITGSALVDSLLAHPDVVTGLWLHNNHLTDETVVKLARYLAASSTIQTLSLSDNRLSLTTYLAVAAALRVNKSLYNLAMCDNRATKQARIDAAFVDALRLNPDRPVGSFWELNSYSNDFQRLKTVAEQLGHPSLQMLLMLIHDQRSNENTSTMPASSGFIMC